VLLRVNGLITSHTKAFFFRLLIITITQYDMIQYDTESLWRAQKWSVSIVTYGIISTPRQKWKSWPSYTTTSILTAFTRWTGVSQFLVFFHHLFQNRTFADKWYFPSLRRKIFPGHLSHNKHTSRFYSLRGRELGWQSPEPKPIRHESQQKAFVETLLLLKKIWSSQRKTFLLLAVKHTMAYTATV